MWGRCFRWVLLLAALVGVMAAGLPQAQAAAPGQTGQVRTVVPLGQAVGIKLFAQGVLVVGLSDITTQEGPVSPARACGLQTGDVITHINDDPVNSIEQVQTVLQDLEGDEMELTVLRDETSRDMTTHAVQCSADGAYKLGAWIRDSMAGIGTLTFYEPETGRFGTLGHGISEDVTDVVYVKYDDHFSAMNNFYVADDIERINRKFLADGKNYVLIGPGRWGSSDHYLGVPVKWPHISAARVIVEVALKNYNIDPSQGTHFFQNLTSFGVGYFTVDTNTGEGGFVNKDMLDAMPAVEETQYVRHVRFDRPLRILMDGKKQEGAVLHPQE